MSEERREKFTFEEVVGNSREHLESCLWEEATGRGTRKRKPRDGSAEKMGLLYILAESFEHQGKELEAIRTEMQEIKRGKGNPGKRSCLSLSQDWQLEFYLVQKVPARFLLLSFLFFL